MRVSDFHFIVSDVFPKDAFALFGATRMRDGHQEQHVVLYRSGSIVERWMQTNAAISPQPRKALRDDE